MILKKINDRVYLFIKQKQLKNVKLYNYDVHRCIGLMEPEDAIVNDPILANTCYMFIDVSRLANFKDLAEMQVLKSNEFTYSVNALGSIKITL
jgi:hypothetical protein